MVQSRLATKIEKSETYTRILKIFRGHRTNEPLVYVWNRILSNYIRRNGTYLIVVEWNIVRYNFRYDISYADNYEEFGVYKTHYYEKRSPETDKTKAKHN